MAKGIARLAILFFSLLVITAAQAVTVGNLLIGEIMVNPAAVSDTRGEWFELYNPTDDEINLRDVVIGDDGSDSQKIETDLLILPGHFLTLGRNDDSSLNRGFHADYVYDGFTLSNSGEEIVFSERPIEWPGLEFGNDFDLAGQSRGLEGPPIIRTNYSLTLAGLNYGLVDIGTPGAAGSMNLKAAQVPVPLPAAAWLFVTGVLVMMKVNPIRRTNAKARLSKLRDKFIPGFVPRYQTSGALS